MTDEYGPWIGWNGGAPPVDADTIVQVADACRGKPEQAKARYFDWATSANPIIAYRVKLEPEVRRWATTIAVVPEENGSGIMVNYKEQESWSPPVPVAHADNFKLFNITATQTGDDDPVFEIERVG